MKIEIPKRSYLHFDRPFSGEEALRIVSDQARVASWSFLPFLHIELKRVRVKRQPDGSKKAEPKDRPIFYAAHRDAALYFYYSELLGARYESLLLERGISDCVTAFRKNRNRCNIHYAKDVFDEIRRVKECFVYTFDVKSFFDNLDHKLLKRHWMALLGGRDLPPDHYSIFKSITRYAYVDRDAAFLAFGLNPHNKSDFKRRFLCDAEEFRRCIREAGLIKRHTDPNTGDWMTKGIPQGSPISALLSNLYMIDFDQKIAAVVNSAGGMYRRYCDDIVCVVPSDCELDLPRLVSDEIIGLALEIHPQKSTTHRFRWSGGMVLCDGMEPLQYLGFLFDGSSIRLRTNALSRYYTKVRKSIRLAHRVRIISDLKLGVRTKLRTRYLHIQYTYLGRRNFLTYGFRAAKVMESEAILKQLKPHLRRFNSLRKYKDERWLTIPEQVFQAIRDRYLRRRGRTEEG